MTEHGFGGTLLLSETPPSPRITAEIAGKISEVKGVIWVHVIKRIERKELDYDIIFEFGHPRKYGWKDLNEFLQAIKDIEVEGHGISPKTRLWIIQSSYKG